MAGGGISPRPSHLPPPPAVYHVSTHTLARGRHQRRSAHARAVHLRRSHPPILYPLVCHGDPRADGDRHPTIPTVEDRRCCMNATPHSTFSTLLQEFFVDRLIQQR